MVPVAGDPSGTVTRSLLALKLTEC